MVLNNYHSQKAVDVFFLIITNFALNWGPVGVFQNVRQSAHCTDSKLLDMVFYSDLDSVSFKLPIEFSVRIVLNDLG
jgi:hypothetical protein